MKKITFISVIVASVLFVSINIFFILKPDSKIERLTFLQTWQSVEQEDIAKTLQTTGVIQPFEEYPIYFHDKNATFHSFHVNKGDEISEGTPLFDYTIDNVDAEKNQLQAEKDKLQSKIESLEDYLQKLSQSKSELENDMDLEEDKQNRNMLTFSVDQDMYAKELEISLLQSEILILDEKMDELDQLLLDQTMESEYAGTVKNINYDLTNPILTIHSSIPVVQGILTEQDVTKVETGMKTYISFPSQKGTYEGEVNQIQPFPKNEATIDQPSEYPFTVSFPEEEEEEEIEEEGDQEKHLPDFPIGTHANIRVVLEEANGALTVPTTSIVKEKEASFIYVITNKGTLKKQQVETGLNVNGRQAIVEGVEKGDLFVSHPADVTAKDSRFFTPIKTANLKKQAFNDLTKKQKLKYVVYGLLY